MVVPTAPKEANALPGRPRLKSPLVNAAWSLSAWPPEVSDPSGGHQKGTVRSPGCKRGKRKKLG